MCVCVCVCVCVYVYVKDLQVHQGLQGGQVHQALLALPKNNKRTNRTPYGLSLQQLWVIAIVRTGCT